MKSQSPLKSTVYQIFNVIYIDKSQFFTLIDDINQTQHGFGFPSYDHDLKI